MEAVEAAAAAPLEGEADDLLEPEQVIEAINKSQEQYEKPDTVRRQKQIGAQFEAFRACRPLNITIVDAFLHTLQHTKGRHDPKSKAASTM